MTPFILRFEDGAGPAWMAGREATVFAEPGEEPKGRPVAWKVAPGERRVAVAEEGGRLRAGFDAAAALETLRLETYREPAKPATRLLPFHYHHVPGAVRIAIGKVLTALESHEFPRWPVDPSGDALRWILGEREGNWPGGKKFALLLSHDVDTQEGMDRASKFFEIEAAAGVPAVYSFVTSTYRIDGSLLRDILALGGEIAWHSDLHDNRIAFEPEEAIRRRIDSARGFIEEYGVTGMRSPSLCRTPALFKVAAERFQWDSSVPDTGPGGGCASVFPYRIGKLLEIPLTMPMDADLVFRRGKPSSFPEAWMEKARYIRDVGGVAVLNTHPEPHFSGRPEAWEAYAEFLRRVKELDPWIVVPKGLRTRIQEAA